MQPKPPDPALSKEGNIQMLNVISSFFLALVINSRQANDLKFVGVRL